MLNADLFARPINPPPSDRYLDRFNARGRMTPQPVQDRDDYEAMPWQLQRFVRSICSM